MKDNNHQREWIFGEAACRRLDVTQLGLRRLAAMGLIGQKVLPGNRTRYNRLDVERLVDDAIIPATTDDVAPAATGAGPAAANANGDHRPRPRGRPVKRPGGGGTPPPAASAAV